jgi:hypothetical protein
LVDLLSSSDSSLDLEIDVPLWLFILNIS